MTVTKRASGILLHITSLPSDYGIGDLGPCSHQFVELLHATKQHYWHILPFTPTCSANGDSPYQPASAFAGNPLLISPELLVKDSLLSKEYAETLKLPADRVDFKAVTAKKHAMLKKAYENFTGSSHAFSQDFHEFCAENSEWLEDYALFAALRCASKKSWFEWPKLIRDRDRQVLERKITDLYDLIGLEKFSQHIFFRQLHALKERCQTRRVSIVGDVPFYVSYDSCDVWVHPEMFKLDARKYPEFVAGVPPDYFSRTGQLWGNPIYNWREMKETGFVWWMNRLKNSLRFANILRLDHFRGFTAYWQIPAPAKTAEKGRWIKAPSNGFFATLRKTFPEMPFIAEDLGKITATVKRNLEDAELPGMRVLVFAFGGSPRNPNLPDNYHENSVVFTGTHDTNTVKGWFLDEAAAKQKNHVYRYLRKQVSADQISREFINLALGSKADLSLIPIQDVLSLGSDARMNRPSRRQHNWEWRLSTEQLADSRIREHGETTQATGRA